MTKRRTWSKDEILYAILEWDEEHGKPPSCNDWWASGDRNPTFTTVIRKFGSWNAAIEAAGLEATPAIREPTFSHEEALRLRGRGLSDVAIARALGVDPRTIGKGLGPRPKPKPTKKNRTREQRIADLRAALTKENI